MEKGLSWLKARMKKNKHNWNNESDVSDSDLSGILFDLFHDCCVPQWKEDLGTGVFGVSCKGLYKDSQGIAHDVAMKFLNHLSEEEAIAVIEAEMKSYVKLKSGHPNIVRCIGGNMGSERDWPWQGKINQINIDGLHYYKVEELLPMNLRELLHEDKKFSQYGTYKDLIRIFHGIASGLKHLQDHGIAHYDLKTSNVLVDPQTMNVKLADFGSSRLRLKRALSAQFKGTPGYMAPELCLQKYMECSEDVAIKQNVAVYALGIIMWEGVTRCTPEQIDRSLEALTDDLEFVGLGDSFFFVHVMCPDELRKLIESCLTFSMTGSQVTTKRPDIKYIKKQLEKMQDADWISSRPTWVDHLTGTRTVPPRGYVASALSNANLDLDLDISVTTTETLGMGPFLRMEAGDYTDSNGETHDVVVKYSRNCDRDQQAKELMLFGCIPRHKNLIVCFGGMVESRDNNKPKEPFVVLERLACDLDTFLWRRQGSLHFQAGDSSYNQLLAQIWMGIASGLQHLHDNGIVYQDLGPTNVLLDFTMAGKLLAVKLGSLLYAEAVNGSFFRMTIIPNLGFMAPEAVLSMHSRSQHLSMALDVYSLGSLMWHCLDEESTSVGEVTLSSSHPTLHLYPPLFFELISDCTKGDPDDRPTCRMVADHLDTFLELRGNL